VSPELDPNRLAEHLDRLYRVAWALCGSREDAEDLVQETYARVLRRPRFLRHDEEIGYLIQVLRNTFLSTRRDASRRPQTAELPDELPVAQSRTAAQPEDAVEVGEVYAALAELPEDFRTSVALIDLAGMSYAEAAASLDITEAALTSRLHRGRRELARRLRS
jgi:RNA polymerase sigma-70 factor (ECF subfamily)